MIVLYRRDCHEEVYAGSHNYPAQGVYLLKFDNSFSLWRNKTLYYRQVLSLLLYLTQTHSYIYPAQGFYLLEFGNYLSLSRGTKRSTSQAGFLFLSHAHKYPVLMLFLSIFLILLLMYFFIFFGFPFKGIGILYFLWLFLSLTVFLSLSLYAFVQVIVYICHRVVLITVCQPYGGGPYRTSSSCTGTPRSNTV